MPIRRTAAALFVVVAALAAAGACQEAAPGPESPASLRVLFIGNSLTYTNNLPATLAGVTAAAGDGIEVEMIALPNYGLIDHLDRNSGAEAAIRRGGWDYVVLQQGPSTLPVNRDSLVLWTERFNPIIRSVGARPALFMVWPPTGQAGGFTAVRESYQAAAAAVDGLFLPAGAAWQDALAQDPSLPLYGPDGFHPGPVGTWLAAITMYEEFTGRDARQLPRRVVVNGREQVLPETQVRLLQEAAHQASARY